MDRIYRIILFLSCFIVLTGCQKEKVSVDGSEYDIFRYTQKEDSYQDNALEFDFSDAIFQFHQLNAMEDSSEKFYQYIIDIPGNEIEISYVEDTNVTTVTTFDELPLSTLYIATDEGYTVASVPTVYEKERVHDSIQTNASYEQPVQIMKDKVGYHLVYSFPKDEEYVSEFFYVQSNNQLFQPNDEIVDILARTELSGKFRLLSDGFYQISYDTYTPSGEGNYFRNPANYIAFHFLTYNEQVGLENEIDYFNDMAYASSYVVDLQMSEEGYFKTESKSKWLSEDFGIDYGYYDTRFNADNAEVNLLLAKRFNDPFFVEVLNRYGDFLVEYTENHSYKTDRGMLVEDYYHPDETTPTHVSLNHQLANMNVLLSLYELTNEEQYLDTALLMLYGIEDTEVDWIMENHNLEYALHYDGTYMILEDYPYLTYNDLFTTKERLASVGIESESIEELMTSKKMYMDEQGITGYFE